MLVALLIEDLLTELGCAVVGPVSSVAPALSLVRGEAIDAALLDVNLSHGETAYPVADALTARGVPFAFVTGYGRAALRDPHRARPALQKPFPPQALKGLLTALAAEAGG